MLDLLLRGGSLVDGTGAPARVADVGVASGRIVAVGEVDDPASHVVDVTGLVVAPGFVDIHTHYDAQVLWDPMASPSSLHGVTTVVGGNCGFSIAPMRSEHADYVTRMLSVVEGMPLESLQAGIDWTWGSFGEWLDRLDGSAGVNMGFLVGHSTIRRVVMGERAVGEQARPDELESMAQLLHQCLGEGAMGLSSSWGPVHVDGDGNPVPSRAAAPDELFTLADVTGQHPGTVLEFAPGIPGVFGDHEVETMIGMSRRANRALNWNCLRVQNDDVAYVDEQLSYGTRAREQDARIVVLTYPDVTFQLVTLSNPAMLWANLPGWGEVMGLPEPAMVEQLRRPEVRQALREGGASARGARSPFLASLARWETLRFAHTVLPEHEALVGRTVGAVADEREQDPLDTLLDVALAEGLATYFEMSFDGEDTDRLWRLRAEVWQDDRALIGASDAGAHVDMACGPRYTTALLGQSVRERQLVPLEQAVHMLTDAPARFYGLRGRGRVEPGWFADLVVFDADRIGFEPIHLRDDFPAGGKRLYTRAQGIAGVFVNGREVVRDGDYVGDLPGTVLRSGRDVDTCPVVETGGVR